MLVGTFALACAWFGRYLLSEVVAEWFFYDSRFDAYWESKSNIAIQSFQSYVTDNNLSTLEALTDTEWNKQNSNIILFTEPAYLYQKKSFLYEFDNSDKSDKYEEIFCSDGLIYATSYLPGDVYFFWWDTTGLLFGILIFLGIVIPFNVYTMHRINKLYYQVLQSSQSGRCSSIGISGKDEIAKLGNEIESMRISLLSLLKNEERTRKESEQMVASLSHDLRTPLTKIIGYLEILTYKKNLTEKEQEIYLGRIAEKAHQMRLLTDELFYNFAAGCDNKFAYLQETIDGGQFINQLLYEECSELQEEGFLVREVPIFSHGYFCHLHIEDIHRAFDNIFSNLKKYADPKFPIIIKGDKDQNQIYVIIENHKRKCSADTISHKIGLMTVKTLIEQNGGSVNIMQNHIMFSIAIFLPCIAMSENDENILMGGID